MAHHAARRWHPGRAAHRVSVVRSVIGRYAVIETSLIPVVVAAGALASLIPRRVHLRSGSSCATRSGSAVHASAFPGAVRPRADSSDVATVLEATSHRRRRVEPDTPAACARRHVVAAAGARSAPPEEATTFRRARAAGVSGWTRRQRCVVASRTVAASPESARARTAPSRSGAWQRDCHAAAAGRRGSGGGAPSPYGGRRGRRRRRRPGSATSR